MEGLEETTWGQTMTGKNCDSALVGGDIWQRREGSAWETASIDGRRRTRGWLREEGRGAEEDKGDDKRCEEKAQKGGRRGNWRKERGLNYCLLPCARTEQGLGSLAYINL